MKAQILVHAHIYYTDLWSTLKNLIKNISPRSFDLYVTTNRENSFLKEDVLKTFPKAHFEVVDNVGYDVWPFLYVLQEVDLDHYDYIIKLHSKRDMPLGSHINYYDVSGSKWRDYALDFISSKERFKATMKAFSENEKLGMVSNYRLIVNKELDDKCAAKQAEELLERVHLNTDQYGYAAGSIFVCRAKLFKPLKKLNFLAQNFEKADQTHHASTMAHACERLFGLLVLAQNNEIQDIFIKETRKTCFDVFLRRLKRFLFLKKENLKGQVKIKICKIPVLVYKKKVKE